MEEIWKEVPGYEGLYEVSNLGRVRSLCYNHTGQTKVLKPHKNSKGYLLAHLCKEGKKKFFIVHRLVAQAFLPNPDNLPEVNHRNEDKTDNRVDNIEFCTAKYNMNFGTRNKRAAKARLNHPALSKPVLQYDKSGIFVKEWPSTMEVERQIGWDQGHISDCCLGKRQSAYRYIWRFVDDVFPATVQDVLF